MSRRRWQLSRRLSGCQTNMRQRRIFPRAAIIIPTIITPPIGPTIPTTTAGPITIRRAHYSSFRSRRSGDWVGSGIEPLSHRPIARQTRSKRFVAVRFYGRCDRRIDLLLSHTRSCSNTLSEHVFRMAASRAFRCARCRRQGRLGRAVVTVGIAAVVGMVATPFPPSPPRPSPPLLRLRLSVRLCLRPSAPLPDRFTPIGSAPRLLSSTAASLMAEVLVPNGAKNIRRPVGGRIF